ncbi:FtsX-like permease family protein [Amphibacillus sediminis]|uniref:FtsX-like permease family protein n=1 Tax=Amphibacillus sediminis TaxID=360185 RepID=UPI000835B1E3|nr:FtsX-like permease family protein [Amphibacillus sediminis]
MARKTTLNKMIVKEIWRSKARFFSILILIFLGVGFFSGLQATGPNMLKTADLYFNRQRLYDIHLQSTLGFEEQELLLLDDFVESDLVEPGYSQDVLAGENRAVFKIISYDPDKQLNQYVVESGRLPEQSGEIALDSQESIKQQYQIGDTIQLHPDSQDTDLDDQFNQTSYEIVGFVTSPRYITIDARGQTNIGRGRIDSFAVILEDDFNLPVYTDLFATFTGLDQLSTYSEAYRSSASRYQEEIEELFEDYGPIRIETIRSDAEEEMAEAEQEIEEARAELADAEAELTDAREQLDEGWQQITEAEAELSDALNELEQGERDYQDGLASFRTEISDAESQLADGRSELEEQQSKIKLARSELEAGEQELAQARAELEASHEMISQQIDQLNQLSNELKEVFQLPVEYIPEQVQKTMIATTEEVDLGNVSLADLLRAYFAGEIDSSVIEQSLTQLETELNQGLDQLNAGLDEINQQERKLDQARNELDQGQEQLDQAEQTLTTQTERLEQERASAQAVLDQARIDLDAGWQEYEQGLKTLEEEKTKLEEADADYQEGLATFETEQADALKKLEDAEQEIADAQAELDDLDHPTYYVNVRADNASIVEYGDNADRLTDLASIFPIVFFAIAALVTLTTITRMIEEQRIEIGTLKALGYSNWEVSLKYYLYAISASLFGTLFGLILGYQILPRIIYNAYQILYNLPKLTVAGYWSFTLISAAIALCSTVLTAWAVLRVDLRSHPASLMRPRAPKIGKRILIERITLLWNRLSFIEKVTARNLFRYKQRMLMTVFGIAGCAALIVTGFGLKGAVTGLGGLQFGQIMKYDAMVVLDNDGSEQEMAAYRKEIEAFSDVEDLAVYQEQFEVDSEEKTYNLNLLVPADPSQLNDFIKLSNRTSGEDYQLSEEGVILTEKIARLLEVEPGDPLTITDSDNQSYQLVVTAITENYATHYLYMSEEAYHEYINNEPIRHNVDLLKYEQDHTWEDALSEQLMEQETVLNISFNSSIIESFEESMDSLNIVVIVLIIAAAGLAFVVLYNLTNINVSERIRELSTIKVLGFYDGEVTMYIYRENLILTLMGIIAGGVLGRALHLIVLETASMDDMMFNPALHWSSYLYSAILTFAFSTFVMWIMHRKLKAVNMIEALKSNE